MSPNPRGRRQLNDRPGLRMAVWLHVEVREHGLGPLPRLHASYVCDIKRRCSISMRLVRYYAFGPAFLPFERYMSHILFLFRFVNEFYVNIVSLGPRYTFEPDLQGGPKK